LTKEMLSNRLPQSEIGQRLGISSSFALGKVLDQARRYPPAGLVASYGRLLEADASIKTGVYREELALELLVADLASVSAAPSARGAPRGLSLRRSGS